MTLVLLTGLHAPVRQGRGHGNLILLSVRSLRVSVLVFSVHCGDGCKKKNGSTEGLVRPDHNTG
jgi:hypothetical protein